MALTKTKTGNHLRTGIELLKLAEHQLEMALAEDGLTRKAVEQLERNLQDVTITRSLLQDIYGTTQ
jgi:hypothetical protein